MSLSSPRSFQQSSSAKRKKSYVSRACAFCRARKIRCDGDRPACNNCAQSSIECQYDVNMDGRRALPKSVAEALQLRVNALEALLKSRNIPFDEVELLSEVDRDSSLPGQPASAQPRRMSWADPWKAPSPASEADLVAAFGIDRLRLDDGDLRQIGPSASFPLAWEGRPAGVQLVHSAESVPYVTAASLEPRGPEQPPVMAEVGINEVDLRQEGSSAPPLTRSLYAPQTKRSHSSTVPLDWNRYIYRVAELSTQRHQEAVDLFFVHVARWGMLFRRDDFLTDLRTCLSPETGSPWRKALYSPLLHNALLAISLGFLDDPALSPINVRSHFAAHAARFLQAELERPMISTIYGLILLARFHGAASANELGYMYSGMALRCAQSMGLGIDCTAFVKRGLISAETKESRDRAFYTCFVLDKLWSFHAGRTAVLTMPVHQINLLDIPTASLRDDVDGGMQNPLEGSGSAGSGLTSDKRSWSSTTFRETVKLCHIAERILKTAYSLHLNIRSAHVQSVIAEINVLLESWLSALPRPLQLAPQLKTVPPAHILTLHIVYHYLVIMLYRPFHADGRDDNENTASTRCLRASARIIHILELYETSPGLRFASEILIHIAFAAGSIQLSHFQSANPAQTTVPEEIISAVRRSSRCLRAIGVTWPLAIRWADHLEDLLRRTMNGGGIAHESPPAPAPQAGMRQMLASRPDLVDELRTMGWIPPAGTTGATTSGNGGSVQHVSSSLDNPMPDASDKERQGANQQHWDLWSALSQESLSAGDTKNKLTDPAQIFWSDWDAALRSEPAAVPTGCLGSFSDLLDNTSGSWQDWVFTWQDDSSAQSQGVQHQSGLTTASMETGTGVPRPDLTGTSVENDPVAFLFAP